MRIAFRLCEPHIHKPLIHFIGKRTQRSKPHTPRPHPAAPPEVASHFSDFVKRFNASLSPSKSVSSSGNTHSNKISSETGSKVYHEYWEAPSNYWARSHKMSDSEIEAILSGGASLRQ